MGNAILSGVTGLKASQTMLDVTGNNLANMNTTAYKSARTTFKDLLYQTLQFASKPTTTAGGMNPQQVGSGVQVATIDRNMNQGTLINTGQPLDMALEGNGFFVLNTGSEDLYSRAGAFAVDADYYLVDPSTGNHVQRIGTEGLADGFQINTNTNIRIPYDRPLPAQATTSVTYVGNLSADEDDPTTQSLSSGLTYTVLSGSAEVPASGSTLLNSLVQVGTNTLVAGDVFTIPLTYHNGGTASLALTFGTNAGEIDTLGELATGIQTAFTAASSAATVNIQNGQIIIDDSTAGYSLLEVGQMSVTGSKMEFPQFFVINSAGGITSRNTNIQIFDSQGMAHSLGVSFVKSATDTWDAVVTDVTNSVSLIDRRIQGITFDQNGALLNVPTVNYFTLRYAYAPLVDAPITANLGTVGKYDGLTQFGGQSTAAPSSQDGYAAGYLTNIQVQSDGVIVGTFSNGLRRDIAALKIATFQNPYGLDSVGNNYWRATGNSGSAVESKAGAGSAGKVRGAALEGSNVDTATEFVNLIQAQNSYQANSRTIRTANDMLRELANLIA
ncbi:MAG: flagellar hook-basal body complex protein [Planctomycetes bacterium]|nr:flagellar hook-basal body complex protein [Planctomycetota bacterium]